jgi:hypothetical protein
LQRVRRRPNTTAAIKRADLNADGHEDYVLDVGSVICGNCSSIYRDAKRRDRLRR